MMRKVLTLVMVGCFCVTGVADDTRVIAENFGILGLLLNDIAKGRAEEAKRAREAEERAAYERWRIDYIPKLEARRSSLYATYPDFGFFDRMDDWFQECPKGWVRNGASTKEPEESFSVCPCRTRSFLDGDGD